MKRTIYTSLMCGAFIAMTSNGAEHTNQQLKDKLMNAVPLTHDIDINTSISLILSIGKSGRVERVEPLNKNTNRAIYELAKEKVINKVFPIKKKAGLPITYTINNYVVELGKAGKEKGTNY